VTAAPWIMAPVTLKGGLGYALGHVGHSTGYFVGSCKDRLVELFHPWAGLRPSLILAWTNRNLYVISAS